MDMAAALQTVSHYLDVHQDWFCRCADPMTAEPLGDNGYALTVGRFGTMGYDIEPRIGLHLLPQDHGVYCIETIPVPGYTPQGYDVDFRAALELKEMPDSATGQVITQVEWTLDLDVAIAFPKFLNALPKAILQKTGNALLNQVVRQASRCLTHKVQDDFHTTLDIPLPESLQNRHHFLERLSKGLNFNA
jgi:ribosome-binding factor A